MDQLTRAVPLVALFGFLVLIGLGGCSATSEGLSDQESVAADKAALVIGYAGTDSAASVTQALTLPGAGDSGTTISWTSSDTAVIANNGAVTRPAANAADATVTLTATITKNEASDTKIFTLTVIKTVEANRAPGAPAISGSTAGDGQVEVTWTAPSDTGIINGDGSEGIITKYTVYWGDSTGFTPSDDKKADVTDTTNTTYTITGLTNGTEVFFIVTATNAAGEGAASTEVSGTPVEANKPPGAPAISGSTAGDGQVEVTWTAPSDTGIINGDGSEGIITKYTVYWGDSTGFTPSDDKKADVTDTTNTTYTITGLTNGTEVFFIVTATNAAGEGAASTERSATPLVAVTGVTIDDKTTTVVTMGGTLKLSATVEPNDATNKGLIWSSGDTSKATVDASGLVTPVAVGGPIAITVTSDTDSSILDTIEITIMGVINSIGYGAIIGTKDVAITSVTPTIEPQGATGAFSVTNGALPTGLSLNSDTGEISGTPTQLTTEAVSVTIAMSGTGDYTGTVTKVVTIEVKYGIGSTGPAGGKIFYENANYVTDGWRYLEAAPSDLSVKYKWGDTATSVTTGTAIGTGESNTEAIILAMEDANFTQDYAAKACANYSSGGKDDWFLPSKDELNKLYEQKDTVGVESNIYWSSSEISSSLAWSQYFLNGYQGRPSKYSDFHVRAVRAF